MQFHLSKNPNKPGAIVSGRWKNWYEIALLDPAGKAAASETSLEAIARYLQMLTSELEKIGTRTFIADGTTYTVSSQPLKDTVGAPVTGSGLALSPWIDVEHCSLRCYAGTDPTDIANRVAFIEKTPRIRTAAFTDTGNDWRGWVEGPKGCGDECGRYEPSRAWCDEQLRNLGYVLP